jgi:hypothetical protein
LSNGERRDFDGAHGRQTVIIADYQSSLAFCGATPTQTPVDAATP